MSENNGTRGFFWQFDWRHWEPIWSSYYDGPLLVVGIGPLKFDLCYTWLAGQVYRIYEWIWNLAPLE